MKITLSSILFIIAVVLFLAQAIGIKVGSVELVSLGLAAFAAGALSYTWKM